MKTKVIRCPIHGYIDLPRCYFEKIVDTPIFQRLRDVEQAEIRPLFPSAHHARFTHALGVYHLAKWVFRAIGENTPDAIKEDACLTEYEAPFAIAALLHDCGHAPFSHILEHYYLLADNYARNRLFELMQKRDPEFRRDYDRLKSLKNEPRPHELFSAVVFLDFFADACKDISGSEENLALVARMITGCVYGSATDRPKQAANCLIRLINGPAIDVDKLDYIVRDNWAAGINAAPVDYYRLLSSVRLDEYENQLETVFHKAAVSVIQGVVETRNWLQRWVYGHHIVMYYQEILVRAVRRAISLLSENGDEVEVVKRLFSVDAFRQPIEIGGYQFYLPTDCDMISLFKQHYDKIPEVAELLSRKPARIPLWKSTGEFDILFGKRTDTESEALRIQAAQILEEKRGIPKDDTLVLEIRHKMLSLETSKVLISFRSGIVPFNEAMPDGGVTTVEPRNRFYVYIPRSSRSGEKEKCIRALKKWAVYA